MAKDIDIKIVVTIDPVWTTQPLPGGFRSVTIPAGWCTPSRTRHTEGMNVTEEFGQLEGAEVEQESFLSTR